MILLHFLLLFDFLKTLPESHVSLTSHVSILIATLSQHPGDSTCAIVEALAQLWIVSKTVAARIVGQSGFCRLLRRKPGNEERRFLFVLFIRLAEAQFKF